MNNSQTTAPAKRKWPLLLGSATAGAVVGATAVSYLRQRVRSADERGDRAPGPSGLPIVGNVRRLDDRLNGFIRLRQEYGDIVRLQIGPRTLHLLTDAHYAQYVLQDNNRNYVKGRGLIQARDLLGDGLLTSEGDFWRRQRRLIQPAFHRRQINTFAQTMTAATADMLQRWEHLAVTGEPVNIAEEMMRLTLDIVSKALFSTALSREEMDQVATVMTPMLRFATKRLERLVDITAGWPTPANRRQEARIKTLDEIVYRIIAARHQSGEQNDDLLAMLMAAQDEESGVGMSDRQLRDEVMTLFLAGHETTANLLAFTFYLLSRNVAVRQRLQTEVDQQLRGRRPEVEDYNSLSYTRQVLDETLRLYPPAWLLGRQPLEDDQIGGYHVPAGSTVLIGVYAIHRHSDYWENPEGFDPDRFAPGAEAERPRYAYLPFGGGPRLCIGNNFALLEAALVLAMISQRYELNLVTGYPVEPEVAFTLRPKSGVWMTVHPRP